MFLLESVERHQDLMWNLQHTSEEEIERAHKESLKDDAQDATSISENDDIDRDLSRTGGGPRNKKSMYKVPHVGRAIKKRNIPNCAVCGHSVMPTHKQVGVANQTKGYKQTDNSHLR